jgi:hypothetical protein
LTLPARNNGSTGTSAPLPELMRRFAAWLDDPAGAPERIAVYRTTIAANYRNALAATYRVVRELVGAPFFDAAVDAFVRAHPSNAGDLNIYGAQFPDFLGTYPHARELGYLPDVARLEWAVDEAYRAADAHGTPAQVLEALGKLAGNEVAGQRFALDPSCRLVRSPWPVMRIWQAHQDGGDLHVDLHAGGDALLVRRDGNAVAIARVSEGELAFLDALANGADLAAALEAASGSDPAFDLGAALRAHIASGAIMALR